MYTSVLNRVSDEHVQDYLESFLAHRFLAVIVFLVSFHFVYKFKVSLARVSFPGMKNTLSVL